LIFEKIIYTKTGKMKKENYENMKKCLRELDYLVYDRDKAWKTMEEIIDDALVNRALEEIKKILYKN
jgi:hypothetical protein